MTVDLYTYSLVRCVPEPRTGEFINVGAIAGSESSGDWEVRQIANMRRASRMCDAEQLSSVTRFLAWASQAIESSESSATAPMHEGWLGELHSDMRNVVQLSSPQDAAGESASEVLDIVFERLLIDPERAARGFVSKHALMAALRKMYRTRLVHRANVLEKPELHVGNHLRSPVDFAVKNEERTLQVSQAWTFQKGTIADVATEVKSWGYALRGLRDGDEARIVANDGTVTKIASDVSVEVVVAPPRTPQQHEVYEEASEVFDELGAVLSNKDDVTAIGDRAEQLVAA